MVSTAAEVGGGLLHFGKDLITTPPIENHKKSADYLPFKNLCTKLPESRYLRVIVKMKSLFFHISDKQMAIHICLDFEKKWQSRGLIR